MSRHSHSTVIFFMVYLLLVNLIVIERVIAEDAMITTIRNQQQALRDNMSNLVDGFLPKTASAKKKPTLSPYQSPKSTTSLYAFPNGVRDPFAVPLRLLQSLAANQSAQNQDAAQLNYAFSRVAAKKMPKIKLKGVMHRPDDSSPLAVVQLNNETYMVRENDEVGFNPANPAQVIKIIKINRLSMLVEVGTLGELVIVR